LDRHARGLVCGSMSPRGAPPSCLVTTSSFLTPTGSLGSWTRRSLDIATHRASYTLKTSISPMGSLMLSAILSRSRSAHIQRRALVPSSPPPPSRRRSRGTWRRARRRTAAHSQFSLPPIPHPPFRRVELVVAVARRPQVDRVLRLTFELGGCRATSTAESLSLSASTRWYRAV
jgi:hypothetical protein